MAQAETTPQQVMDDLLQVTHRVLTGGSPEQWEKVVLPLVQAWATISSTLQIGSFE